MLYSMEVLCQNLQHTTKSLFCTVQVLKNGHFHGLNYILSLIVNMHMYHCTVLHCMC